ncbi:MAG: putative Ig domain-containing protein, partial [Pseudomonadota bacterium]
MLAIAATVAGCGGEEGGGGGGTPPPPEDTNAAPTIDGSPAERAETGILYTFVPNASDADRDALTFKVDNAPRWTSFSTADGTLSGMPQQGDVGTYPNIVISVSDGVAESALEPFEIVVVSNEQPPAPPPAPSNRAPSIFGDPSTEVIAGESYRFTPGATDADGDSLFFSISTNLSWASFSADNGTLSGTPSLDDVGTYENLVITVSDGSALDSLPPFTLVVRAPEIPPPPPNSPPVITGMAPASVGVDLPYLFIPSASDADGDTLAFSVANLPSWASFSATTGSLSGTPTESDTGDYAGFTISVSDGVAVSSLAPFTITVEAGVNSAPTISGVAPTSVLPDAPYDFEPSA